MTPGQLALGYTSPMSSVKQLYGLQEIDLKLSEAETLRESLLNRLSDRSELLASAERLERLEKRKGDFSARTRALERLVAEVDVTLERLNERLYGGGVTNPQQLAAAQEEQAFTAARKKEAEDQLLEIMIDMEELEPVLTEARETASRLHKERPGLQRPGGKRSARPHRRSRRFEPTGRLCYQPCRPTCCRCTNRSGRAEVGAPWRSSSAERARDAVSP